MKYIPGTTFLVGQPKPKQGGSVLQQRSAIVRPIETTNFKLGNQYTLYKITPVTNTQFEYHFMNMTNGSTFTHTFSGTEAADKLIDGFFN